MTRLLNSVDDVAEGAAWLAKTHPPFARALELVQPLPLRRNEAGFSAMLRSIVAQQISVAAAAGIWARVEAAGATTPEGILSLSDEGLRALGLSRPKARYARALAEAQIDFDALPHLDTDDILRQLTAVTGIGRWTAEIYVMFALGRADVFCAGDLALQEGARLVFDLPERPKERALRDMAQSWSPWRTVAATLLWAYYGYHKNREGVQV